MPYGDDITEGLVYTLSNPAGSTNYSATGEAYDIAIAANDTTCLTLGLTLATTDVVTVYAGTATMSFAAFGSEIS
jgi:hypothetical protein